MSKYRIVSNGHRFKVQRKIKLFGFGFWEDCSRNTLSSLELAKSQVADYEQLDAQRAELARRAALPWKKVWP